MTRAEAAYAIVGIQVGIAFAIIALAAALIFGGCSGEVEVTGVPRKIELVGAPCEPAPVDATVDAGVE